MDMRACDSRFANDPTFRAYVQSMYRAIEELHLTPSEAREAAMYAAVLVEQDRPAAPIFMSPTSEKAMRNAASGG